MDEGVTPQEHWERARAFRDKSQEELATGDRLKREGGPDAGAADYALALADAVSAAKESLHGFVSFVTGTHYDDYVSLPKLLAESEDIGLALGESAADLRRFNWIRNTRIHRQPGRVVSGGKANVALRTARTIDALVRAAIEGKQPAARASSAQSVAVATAGTAPAGIHTDSTPPPTRPRVRALPVFWRLAAALVLLVIGLAAGLAAGSHALGGPFAIGSSPGGVSAAPTATATAASPQTAAVGSLTVTPPVCQVGTFSFDIRNLDTTSAAVAVGSPDASGTRFALSPDGASQPTLIVTVAAQSTVTVYILNPPAHGMLSIDVLAPAGTVHLAASAC